MSFNPYTWADRLLVDLPEHGIQLDTLERNNLRLLIGETLQAVWIDAKSRQGTPISDLDTLQRMITIWASLHFPNSTMSSKITHLRKELEELEREPSLEECADMLGILLRIAEELGGSLMAASVAKFQINLNRQWLPPDQNGVVEHDRTNEGHARSTRNAAHHFMNCTTCRQGPLCELGAAYEEALARLIQAGG